MYDCSIVQLQILTRINTNQTAYNECMQTKYHVNNEYVTQF